MKEYLLSYYNKFKCIAGKCKHTCCAGWEMNIDAQSLIKYKQNETVFSAFLKSGINFKRSKFKSDKSKRCAFLNDEGLCELIINLGEESLCQVCRDHPRFRSFFDDRTEMGLGFCCEEASRIILSYQDKIDAILVNDDGLKEEVDFTQKHVLEFRKKALEIIQDRAIDINDRIVSLLTECRFDFSEKESKKIISKFLSFEKLDKEWAKRLKSIGGKFIKDTENDSSLYCEQFLVNGIYRHLSDAEDTMWVRARTIALVFSWWVINSIIKEERVKKQDLFEIVVDVVRAYSAEVEYSQKNLNKLFSLCYKYINV